MARPDTDAVHGGEGIRHGAAPLITPIYQSSTFVFASAAELERYVRGERDQYLYSRHANPTVEAAEAKIAALEGAEAAVVTASGMAATATALFGLLRSGDTLLASAAIYGGSLQLMTAHLARFGVKVRLAATSDDLAALVDASTRLVWFESPTNPTLDCIDIARVADACRHHGALSVFDNTFATPIHQLPLSLGVDLVMHSATKYLNGHSDVVAGALAGSRALIDRVRETRKLLGGVLDPGAAFALTRGMKTLAVRVARQSDTAARIAAWLAADPRVSQVLYPGLPSHPGHAIARAQMRAFGGMVTFRVGGTYEAACRVFDRLTLIQRAASLGGVESICSLPVMTSHYGVADAELEAAGVTRDMIRLSIGLEHPDDLIADLDRALGDG